MASETSAIRTVNEIKVFIHSEKNTRQDDQNRAIHSAYKDILIDKKSK